MVPPLAGRSICDVHKLRGAGGGVCCFEKGRTEYRGGCLSFKKPYWFSAGAEIAGDAVWGIEKPEEWEAVLRGGARDKAGVDAGGRAQCSRRSYGVASNAGGAVIPARYVVVER